jgi:hypothetical protein
VQAVSLYWPLASLPQPGCLRPVPYNTLSQLHICEISTGLSAVFIGGAIFHRCCAWKHHHCSLDLRAPVPERIQRHQNAEPETPEAQAMGSSHDATSPRDPGSPPWRSSPAPAAVLLPGRSGDGISGAGARWHASCVRAVLLRFSLQTHVTVPPTGLQMWK